MRRYSEKHYEDVARILRLRYDYYRRYEPRLALESTAQAFVILFAADNPLRCRLCRVPDVGAAKEIPHTDSSEHEFTEGFDRKKFLEACGLGEGE